MTTTFVYITHKNGVADDSALELCTAAKTIDSTASPCAIVLGSVSEVKKVAKQVSHYYSEVITIMNEALSYPNAEVVQKILSSILPPKASLILSHNSFSMDLAPGLSIILDTTFAADVVSFEKISDEKIILIRQEYGGAVSSRSICELTSGIVISIRASSFQACEGGVTGNITDRSAEIVDFSSKRKFIEIIDAEIGDIDVTKSEILVAIGRGIGEEDNIDIAQELAKTIGAEVVCSRPIVDAKWLEKSRQVGTSGQTVSPKIYLALGISGSFQHMGGIKNSPFIVAVNKNPKAPIFQIADIGIVADILDFLPILTDAIDASK